MPEYFIALILNLGQNTSPPFSLIKLRRFYDGHGLAD
jgi:hypothetical protein